MKTYSGFRWVVNEAGRPHRVSADFKAPSFEVAECLGELEGVEDIGELVEVIPAPELNALCAKVAAAWNEAWNH